MRQATHNSSGFPSRLSSLFRDAMVREAFERAERDGPAPLAVAADRPRVLDGGGAAERVLVLEVA